MWLDQRLPEGEESSTTAKERAFMDTQSIVYHVYTINLIYNMSRGFCYLNVICVLDETSFAHCEIILARHFVIPRRVQKVLALRVELLIRSMLGHPRDWSPLLLLDPSPRRLLEAGLL